MPATASINQASFEIEHLVKLRNEFIIPIETHKINWSAENSSMLKHLEGLQFTIS